MRRVLPARAGGLAPRKLANECMIKNILIAKGLTTAVYVHHGLNEVKYVTFVYPSIFAAELSESVFPTLLFFDVFLSKRFVVVFARVCILSQQKNRHSNRSLLLKMLF